MCVCVFVLEGVGVADICLLRGYLSKLDRFNLSQSLFLSVCVSVSVGGDLGWCLYVCVEVLFE